MSLEHSASPPSCNDWGSDAIFRRAHRHHRSVRLVIRGGNALLKISDFLKSLKDLTSIRIGARNGRTLAAATEYLDLLEK